MQNKSQICRKLLFIFHLCWKNSCTNRHIKRENSMTYTLSLFSNVGIKKKYIIIKVYKLAWIRHMLEDDLLVRIFGTDCTRKYRSFEALLRSRFEFIGVRSWNSRQASMVCCSTTRQFEGFCERAENALMPYARSKPRVVFPRSSPTIQRNSARNCEPVSHGHQVSVCDSIFNDWNFDFIEI